MTTLSISIVCHGQFDLAKLLLEDINQYCQDTSLEVILTLNLPENLPHQFNYHFPLKIIRNKIPKGFGANHNQAFREATGDFFCVLNPDIRLQNNPFPDLLQNNSGVKAPQIYDENANVQDNAREFLTPLRLLKRVLTQNKTIIDAIHPDWVAGMFMVFPTEIYKKLNGFDEKYYLYCEDMDICWRLRKKGYDVTLDKNTKAIHTARRDSHKKLKYLYWHLKSLFIFFCMSLSHTYTKH